MTSDSDGMARLDAAMDAWLRFRRGEEGESAEAFLARYADLEDLLRPMLEDDSAIGKAPDATAPFGDRDGSRGGRTVERLGDGDFRLLDELGRGGMGVVFESQQVSLDRRVAVKVLSDRFGQSATAVARFKREALTAARLDHPGIVAIYAVGEEQDCHWFAMERIVGDRLDDHARSLRQLRAGSFVQDVVDLVARVADALHHAHEAGVIHRDVKPSNVLVRAADGTPVLTDFGLAREQSLPSLTQTGDLAGTPYYVSPEQARGRLRELDRRTDVFSLGVTLYELLTARRPFRGRTSQAVLQEIMTREPADPRGLNPELPSDLAAVVMHALEKDPSDRYQSAAEFADDLRRFLAYRPVLARHVTRLGRLRRWLRREPVKAGALGVVLVAGLLAAGLGSFVVMTREARAKGEETLTQERIDNLLLGVTLRTLDPNEERVVATLREALSLAPLDPQVVGTAALYFMERRVDGRMTWPEQALTILDHERHREVAQRDPGLLRLRAMVLEEMGDTDGAREILERLGPPTTSLEHYALGLEAYRVAATGGGDDALEAARVHLHEALLLARTARPAVHVMYSQWARRAGQQDLAERAANALVTMWPDHPAVYVLQSLTLSETDEDGAKAAAERAVEIDPTYAWPWLLLGRFAMFENDLEAASEHLERSFALDAYNIHSRRMLAVVREELGDLDGAAELHRLVFESDPRDLDAGLKHVELLRRLGRTADARVALDAVAERFPDHPDVLAARDEAATGAVEAPAGAGTGAAEVEATSGGGRGR